MFKQSKGFSLLELLIVLVIASAVVTLVAPRIKGSFESLQLKSVSRDIATSLRATRLLAISKGREAIWTLDLKQHHYQYGKHIKTVSLPQDIDIKMMTASKEHVSSNVANIRFFPDGSATGGEVLLSRGKLDYAIQIDWLTGRVKIYD